MKLPFAVEPRRKPVIEQVGSEESGKIEIERRGYLTTGEKAFVQQAVGYDSSSKEIINLSRRVSNAHGISVSESYDLVIQSISGFADEKDKAKKKILEKIAGEYSFEIDDIVTSLTELQSKESLILATCLLRYRVDDEIGIQDVLSLHPDIIDGLVNLYRDEENKSIDRLLTDEERAKKQEPVDREQELLKKPMETTENQ